jgi:hypothetical protein
MDQVYSAETTKSSNIGSWLMVPSYKLNFIMENAMLNTNTLPLINISSKKVLVEF